VPSVTLMAAADRRARQEVMILPSARWGVMMKNPAAVIGYDRSQTAGLRVFGVTPVG
jgi:hypothetical protein